MKPTLKFNHRLPKLLGRRTNAVTLGRTIYFRGKPEDVDVDTLVHELVHVEQYRKSGVFAFLLAYALAWLWGLATLKGLRGAYRAIPAEIEAYGLQKNPARARFVWDELGPDLPEPLRSKLKRKAGA